MHKCSGVAPTNIMAEFDAKCAKALHSIPQPSSQVCRGARELQPVSQPFPVSFYSIRVNIIHIQVGSSVLWSVEHHTHMKGSLVGLDVPCSITVNISHQVSCVTMRMKEQIL